MRETPPSSAAPDADTITKLVRACDVDEQAAEELWSRIHADVRRMAHALMARERADDSLESAGLVNEVYINLLKGNRQRFENRAHFFGAVSNKMKQILIDRARTRDRQKRGGGKRPVSLAEGHGARGKDASQLQDIEEAICKLEALDHRKALVVRMRFFMELTNDETAVLLGVARRTVVNDWTFARAWLRQQMAADAEGADGGDLC